MRNKKANNQILIRADADKRIGLGHIKRCITLSKEIKKRKYDPVVIIKKPDTGVVRLLRSEKIKFIVIPKNISLKKEAEKVSDIIREKEITRVILDSYDMDAEYMSSISASGAKTMMLDDRNYITSPDVDLLVNGNSFASELKYRLRNATKAYLGEDYYILDKVYTSGKRKTVKKTAQVISICLSGVEFEVFDVLIDFLIGNSEAKVEAYFTLFQKKIAEKLKKLYKREKRFSGFLDLSEKRLAERLKKADMAICSGGTIIYKAIASGCAVFGLAAVGAQNRNIRSLERKGYVLPVKFKGKDNLLNLDKKKIIDVINSQKIRKKMVTAGLKSMDGKGAERVAGILLR